MMGAVSRGFLPEFLRAATDMANPGEIIGPIEMDGLWYLIRYEKFLPASFDETLKKELEEELLER
jgi:parvulin-like peptidyl-prolyl isomerase